MALYFGIKDNNRVKRLVVYAQHCTELYLTSGFLMTAHREGILDRTATIYQRKLFIYFFGSERRSISGLEIGEMA